MDQHEKSIRVGATVIACALALRLSATGFFQPVVDFLTQPNIASFFLYLETGRKVRFSPSLEETIQHSAESPPPAVFSTVPTEPAAAVFSADQAETIEFFYSGRYRPDIESLFQKPLMWNLKQDEPTVLILHTHTTESYTKVSGQTYQESAAFRTLNESYNMLSIGDRLAELLEAGGIHVIHDRELHDYPSYNGSYADARKQTQTILEQYPSIVLVLDLHRDASDNNGAQMRTYATVNGVPSAQIMLVMGTDEAGIKHPNWEENLVVGLKLYTQLEQLAPGICRPINLRSQRFNQDLSTGAMILEMGAAGNTQAEALVAAEVLAQAILALAEGSLTTDSTS